MELTWLYRLAADAVVVLHGLFILFVIGGGLLVLKWRWLLALHLPAVLWGVTVEALHLICPLTPLENHLRRAAGEAGYPGSYVDHYLLPLIYPAGLTPQVQLYLGALIVVINGLVYAHLWRSMRR
ncbi:DUF2784 domain-containing protein [Pseudomonas sp. LS44]|uniref:DUF2784 domain-containing protein n=1 Tax=Pseudomonas sp. LS44 TaxID=1357074 RepID=UPI00215A3AE4|nr:DUF2784 domain-containing protein [Pseudomonas sp. LS44]UVE19087.1 DUF2784 domain-containing protein [Pseudomonas sp. LS44]